MISLLDPEGVRHEINVETWVSQCNEWVVQQMEGRCEGKATRYRTVRTVNTYYLLGGSTPQHVGGVRQETGPTLPFGEHVGHVTCIACIGGDGWPSP